MTAVPALLGRVRRDAEGLALPRLPPGTAPVVTAGELAGLPPVVRRYLDFMGVVGRPRDRSFRARFTGRFRLGPGRRWMRCEAWQYDLAEPVTRLFHMRLSAGPVRLTGDDVYATGRGRMRGRLFGLLPVVDGSGPEFDTGELTTYLNDCVLVAPSMLLGPATTWAAAGDSAFDVTLADAGITVTARVTVDEAGAPVDFRTTDRWAALRGGLVRAPWSTPVDGWTVVRGRPVPRHGRAVWHLDDGEFTYGEGAYDPETVEWDVPAGRPAPRPLRAVAETAGGLARLAGATITTPVLRSSYNRWGATDAEVAARMPGDELVPRPVLGYTRAVTIDAPPGAVWPWLVQIGHGRGGLYSYDALENLAGCRLHSADRILPEHQHLAAGDLVRLGPEGYPAYRVAQVEAPRLLVLSGAGEGFGATWQWLLAPVRGGRTRLVVRQRLVHPRSRHALWRLVEPVNFVMEQRMLHGIKARAESMPSPRRVGVEVA